MPHTARHRPKPTPSNKLRNRIVNDSDGWTTVLPSRPHPLHSSPQSFPDLKPHDMIQPTPASTRKALEEYKKHKSRWQASEVCKVLTEKLEDILCGGKGNIKVKNIVCLGLGSFTEMVWGRPEICMLQLAALETVGESVEKWARCKEDENGEDYLDSKTDIPASDPTSASLSNTNRPQIYVQDPRLSPQDIALLSSLNMTVLSVPKALPLIDKTTFLFTPFVDRPILLPCLVSPSTTRFEKAEPSLSNQNAKRITAPNACEGVYQSETKEDNSIPKDQSEDESTLGIIAPPAILWGNMLSDWQISIVTTATDLTIIDGFLETPGRRVFKLPDCDGNIGLAVGGLGIYYLEKEA